MNALIQLLSAGHTCVLVTWLGDLAQRDTESVPALEGSPGLRWRQWIIFGSVSEAASVGSREQKQLTGSRRTRDSFLAEPLRWPWRVYRLWTQGEDRERWIEAWRHRLEDFRRNKQGTLARGKTVHEAEIMSHDTGNQAEDHPAWSWLSRGKWTARGGNKIWAFQCFWSKERIRSTTNGVICSRFAGHRCQMWAYFPPGHRTIQAHGLKMIKMWTILARDEEPCSLHLATSGKSCPTEWTNYASTKEERVMGAKGKQKH